MKFNFIKYVMERIRTEDTTSKTAGILDTTANSSLKPQSKSHYFEGMVPTATIQELVEEPG